MKKKIEDFEPGMKVTLDGEEGTALNEVLSEVEQRHTSKNEQEFDGVYGYILWDTGAEVEDWCGLFGVFIQSGGKVISSPDTKEEHNGD